MSLFILIILVLVGAALGGQINRAIYRWAWNQRSISPWSKPPENATARSWKDCMPVIGWWGMRRESNIHGAAFWVRPMLIELVTAAGLAALYWWVVLQGGQLPVIAAPAMLEPRLRQIFLAHAVLFGFMLIATFIDIDEKTIPDFVTVPGTLIALGFAALLPNSMLPVMTAPNVEPILLTSPRDWNVALNGTNGLWMALGCWLGWCYAILPKTICGRHGLIKGAQYLLASIVRHPLSKLIGLMAIAGCVLIAVVWNMQGAAWQGLLSALVGLAFGGGLVWAIRLVGGYAMGVEAMGFGDVTLMAMIGAFLGWQAAMLTFFFAPFTAIVIAVSQQIMSGRRDIPFGPFLCTAATIVIIGWGVIWESWRFHFSLGIFIPAILVCLVALMGVMLAVLQVVKRMLGIGGFEAEA